MPLELDKVKNLLLDELRAKGYAPNPGDVAGAAAKLVEMAKEVVKEVVKEVAEDKPAAAAAPVAAPVMPPKP